MAADASVANRSANLKCCSWHSRPKLADDDLAASKDFDTKQLNLASCQSLRISYKDPSFTDRLTEDVFLDPRDSLHSSEDGLLLVSCHGVSALQQQSNRENRWVESVHAVVNSCRHDYLREHQYLLEELRKIARMAPRELDDDIEALLDGAPAVTEEAAEGAKLVVSTEDARAVTESVGPSYAQDQELLRFLEDCELSRDLDDELMARIILKGMRADTEALRLERDREQEAVQAVEGSDEVDDDAAQGIRQLMETMLWKARDDDVGVKEVVDEMLLRVTSAEERQEIEDAITKGLRDRFSKLLAHLEEMKPKIEQWRAALRESQAKEARVQALFPQVEEAKDQLRQKEKDVPTPQEEEDRGGGRELEPKASSWDARDNLPAEKQLLLRNEEQVAAVLKRRQHRSIEELQETEHRVHEYSEMETRMRSNWALAEQGLADAHDRLASLEVAEVAAQDALQRTTAAEVELRQQRERLDDEHAIATKPPKLADTSKIEEEVQQARIKNEELMEEEVRLQMREREYEGRYNRTEESWKAEQEERAAAALAAELAAAEFHTPVASRDKPEGPSDPMLHAYSGRATLPEFSQVSRFDLLHTDSQAREKRLHLSRMQRDASEREFAAVLAHHESTQEANHTSIGSSSACSRSLVPVTFRRPEDLRVRFAMAQQSLEQLSQCSTESSDKGVHYRAEMQRLGKTLAESVIASSQLHASIASHFAEQLDGMELLDCAARDALDSVLKLQLECASRAGALANEAELACKNGAEHWQMLHVEEACAQSDRDLSMAVDKLGHVEMQATREGTHEIAALTKRCSEGFAGAQDEFCALIKARETTWSRVLSIASRLTQERAAQQGITRALRSEEVRRNLLGAELVAPPPARRALAAMRAARSGLVTSQATLLH